MQTDTECMLINILISGLEIPVYFYLEYIIILLLFKMRYRMFVSKFPDSVVFQDNVLKAFSYRNNIKVIV